MASPWTTIPSLRRSPDHLDSAETAARPRSVLIASSATRSGAVQSPRSGITASGVRLESAIAK
eukprot:6490400-Amphidinium_carterae.1